ncbi:alpha/beta hydrolase family protein [Paenibacillus sp. VCA1]|uniref:alpha/beta hydrolase family protein n=1 Tax=Paenibacillus sp. VCA1 TaxID=3039148 RepID=UPI002871CD6E|nr:alpha/beta hydrolase family protein [Paenibacillus sp. VCA1]MDR9856027.1 alpha/beta hydrolase family protein [Paenibacillus sp. VCA1]
MMSGNDIPKVQSKEGDAGRWNPDPYLNRLAEEAGADMAFRPGADWPGWREGLKERVTSLLGGFPERAAALDPVVLERTTLDDHIRERIEITTYEGLRMPIYVLLPLDAESNPRPVVMALHGHGYGSREIVGLEPDGSERSGPPGLHKDFALELARRGFVVAAPELLGFGDRRLAEDLEGDPKKSSCHLLALHLLMSGRTLAGYRVYETMRSIDYMQTRTEADPDRIGCMGISGGGLVASFASALDDRIGAAVVSGYANTFEDSILTRSHCIDNYVPGIMREARMADVIGLIAPRALLLEAGSEDRVFPLEGAKRAYAALEQIYEAAGAKDRLEADFFAGGHEISGRIAYGWLARQLGAAEK